MPRESEERHEEEWIEIFAALAQRHSAVKTQRAGFFQPYWHERPELLCSQEWESALTLPIDVTFPAGSTLPTARSVFLSWSAQTTPDLKQLRDRTEALELRVRELEEQVKELTAKLEERDKVIVLRTISREEAKAEILVLFKQGDVLDYGVISQRLELDLPLVVDICNELEREGLIG